MACWCALNGATESARAEDEPPLLTATLSRELQPVGSLAMRMPTDVAIGPDGTVFVADGVFDRILKFDATGAATGEIRALGEVRLSSPVGIAVDADGRLWIADSGNARIVVVDSPNAPPRLIPLPPRTNGKPCDPTDLAISNDGTFAWVADNDGHRLLRIDTRSGVVEKFGRHGESLGELDHPFMLAVMSNDSILVSDVINGRIGMFNRNGAPTRAIGAYGIELGQLYRPKGVAVDSKGRVWVSDGYLGVVQVFTSDGTVIDVLRDESGQRMHFEVPMGMAFDREGHLYVTELGADRVRKLQITDHSDKRKRVDARRPRASVTGRQARSCTLCHIEFMEPFASGRPTDLGAVPDLSPEHPAVSKSEMCLSCHDGSVGDSRRRVWQEHGHQTGITPPGVMRVPAELPLVEGQIACRTCHSAHGGGRFSGDMATTIFLRVENNASQLCMGCHEDHTRGPTLGTHPTGGMPWAVPQELIDAGARIGPNPREITCQVCHTPHGASHDHLLVMGVESNQLCLTCHSQMRPGMFRDDAHSEHPLNPVVNAEQKAAVLDMNTRLGPNDKLICLSCHKLHHGKGERFLLARELREGRMCIQCHSEKSAMFGSSHDLRLAFPEERNRLGMTPESGGPCSSCHMFHRYARAPEFHPIDTTGQCITCHQEGRCAESSALGGHNHPGVGCTGCHDPHETSARHFLRDQPAQLCASCHSDQALLAGGRHDFCAGDEKAWPGASREANDSCLACHRPHSTPDGSLWRVSTAGNSSDATCVACHSSADWKAGGGHGAMHPRAAVAASTSLPLVSIDEAHTRGLGCKTCHNPHSATDKLLRVSRDAPASDLCIQCHSPMQQILLTAHADIGGDRGHGGAACRACHGMHAEPAALGSSLLALDPLPAGFVVADNEDSACVSCHRSGGRARPPAIASHPPVPMLAPGIDGFTASLPLFDDAGAESVAGRMTCKTCHVPHGQPVDPATSSFATTLSAGERGQMRLMLRPFAPPNACTTCHGAEGLWRFLYFHDPVLRTGG